MIVRLNLSHGFASSVLLLDYAISFEILQYQSVALFKTYNQLTVFNSYKPVFARAGSIV